MERAGVIRVLLADDHPLVPAGFAMILDARDEIAVVGEADDGAAALALVAGTLLFPARLQLIAAWPRFGPLVRPGVLLLRRPDLAQTGDVARHEASQDTSVAQEQAWAIPRMETDMDEFGYNDFGYDTYAAQEYEAATLNEESIDTMDTTLAQAEEFDATLNDY